MSSTYPDNNAGLGSLPEEVSHSTIYHKLGTLEGLLLSVQVSMTALSGRLDRSEERLTALERADSGSSSVIKVSAWAIAAMVVPLMAAVMSWALLRWLPPAESSRTSRSPLEAVRPADVQAPAAAP